MEQQKSSPGSPSNSGNRAFLTTYLALMVAIVSPEHPFYLHVWAFSLPHFTFWECHFTFSGVSLFRVNGVMRYVMLPKLKLLLFLLLLCPLPEANNFII